MEVNVAVIFLRSLFTWLIIIFQHKIYYKHHKTWLIHWSAWTRKSGLENISKGLPSVKSLKNCKYKEFCTNRLCKCEIYALPCTKVCHCVGYCDNLSVEFNTYLAQKMCHIYRHRYKPYIRFGYWNKGVTRKVIFLRSAVT